MKIGTKVKIAVGKARGVGSIAGKDEDVLGTFYQYSEQNAPCFSYGDECEQIINP